MIAVNTGKPPVHLWRVETDDDGNVLDEDGNRCHTPKTNDAGEELRRDVAGQELTYAELEARLGQAEKQGEEVLAKWAKLEVIDTGSGKPPKILKPLKAKAAAATTTTTSGDEEVFNPVHDPDETR